MCLLLLLIWLALICLIAPKLSINSLGLSVGTSSSPRKLANHSSSLPTVQAATYSASELDRATIDCCRELKTIGLPDNNMTTSDADLLVLLSPAQAASEKASIVGEPEDAFLCFLHLNSFKIDSSIDCLSKPKIDGLSKINACHLTLNPIL